MIKKESIQFQLPLSKRQDIGQYFLQDSISSAWKDAGSEEVGCFAKGGQSMRLTKLTEKHIFPFYLVVVVLVIMVVDKK